MEKPTFYELVIGAIGSTIALILRVALIVFLLRVFGVDI